MVELLNSIFAPFGGIVPAVAPYVVLLATGFGVWLVARVVFSAVLSRVKDPQLHGRLYTLSRFAIWYMVLTSVGIDAAAILLIPLIVTATVTIPLAATVVGGLYAVAVGVTRNSFVRCGDVAGIVQKIDVLETAIRTVDGSETIKNWRWLWDATHSANVATAIFRFRPKPKHMTTARAAALAWAEGYNGGVATRVIADGSGTTVADASNCRVVVELHPTRYLAFMEYANKTPLLQQLAIGGILADPQ